MLYLIRHAEAEGNAAGRIMGWDDLPLTERGRRQARALGQWLRARGVAFAAIYTSDLRRARDTAEILAAACGNPPVLVRPELREVGRGAVEGKTYAEAAALRTLPGVAETFEPEEEVAARLRRAAAELLPAARAAEVAAVAHGGSLSRLLRLLLGLPPAPGADGASFVWDNTGLTVVDPSPPRAAIRCVNALYHLPEEAGRWLPAGPPTAGQDGRGGPPK
jgi:broad specificity phosphatase PhoE